MQGLILEHASFNGLLYIRCRVRAGQILEVALALAEACWLWLARFCDRLLRSRNLFPAPDRRSP